MDDPVAAPPKRKRLFTTRKVFSLIGFVTATFMLWFGKIGGEEWVYVLVIVIAGHHAQDLIRAWKK